MDIAFLYQITKKKKKLKSITLLEATELIKQIEETFGVDTSKVSEQSQILTTNKDVKTVETKDKEEVSSFDIILQEVPSEEERSKRLTVFRIIRELTSLGLRESKELTNSLPKSIKESVSKQEAEEAKKQLEAVGAKVLIQ